MQNLSRRLLPIFLLTVTVASTGCGPIERMTILVDGVPHPPTALRMPRPDLFRSLHPRLASGARRDPGSVEDPELRSYRSGFWGTFPIPARDRPGCECDDKGACGRSGARYLLQGPGLEPP